MLRLALVACFISIIAAAAVGSDSEKVILNGKEYVKEDVLKFSEVIPLDLVVDYHTGNIFYIAQIEGVPGYKAYILRKNSIEPELIQGLKSAGQAFAIDQTKGTVYIGTENGIYKYDDVTKTSSKLDYVTNGIHDIIYLVVTNDGKTLYYLEVNSQITHKLATDLKTPVEQVSFLNDAYDLTLDHQNNFYYTNIKIPYVVKAGQTKNKLITEGGDDIIKFQHFTVDNTGKVFTIDSEGNIFTINADEAKATKIGKVNLPGEAVSLAIEENGNILIGYKNGVFRLKKI